MYKKKAHIHFIGIGGIGMSGIATILKYQGYTISGCDSYPDQLSIKNLKNIGCAVMDNNNTGICTSEAIDIVVYSSAIRPDNPEIVAAQQRGIATIPRALMLAELMRTKYSIAVAGAHGKTTTTSLISHILIEAGLDPTVIVGGHLKALSHNARFGAGDFLVAEADESDRSLTHLHPTCAVVTNIDLEHLETYQDLADIKNTFKQFLNSVPFYGKAFVCGDDEHIASLLPITHVSTTKYGIHPTNDLIAYNIALSRHHSTFEIRTQKKILGSARLNMPGQHNILNALGATALALDLDVPFATIGAALTSFQGVDQRFTFRGTYQGAQLFDDYGHHPKEIAVTLEVARRCASNKLCVVFQPHRYTRTYHLWQNFLEVFLSSTIDHLIITDIYPASEAPIDTITSERLVRELQALNPSFTCEYFSCQDGDQALMAHIERQASAFDLILFLGAGRINKLAQTILKQS